MAGKANEQYGEQETKKRMDDALRRALNTPPKPHIDIAGKRPKSPKRAVKKAKA
jgi:hypothetical protein